MARKPWDPSLGPSRPRVMPRAYSEARPLGIGYLERALAAPRSAGKLAAFGRFRLYIERRVTRRASKMTALDRAIAAELQSTDPRLVCNRRGEVDLPASALAVVYGLAREVDCSPKTVIEALILIGIEHTSNAIREAGFAVPRTQQARASKEDTTATEGVGGGVRGWIPSSG